MNSTTGDNFKEICAHFGLAYYMSSVLEHGVVNALFALELLSKRASFDQIDQWEDTVQQYYEDKFSKTLGNLKKLLSHHLSNNPNCEGIILKLDQCLKKRNYLAHHFWRIEYQVAQSNALTREKIHELEEIASFFKQVDKEVEDLIWPLYRINGITPSMVEEYVRLTLQSKVDD